MNLPEFLNVKGGLSNLDFVFKFYDNQNNVILETRTNDVNDAIIALGGLELSTTIDLSSTIGQLQFSIKPSKVINQFVYSKCTFSVEKKDLGDITDGYDFSAHFLSSEIGAPSINFIAFVSKYNCIVGAPQNATTYPNIAIIYFDSNGGFKSLSLIPHGVTGTSAFGVDTQTPLVVEQESGRVLFVPYDANKIIVLDVGTQTVHTLLSGLTTPRNVFGFWCASTIVLIKGYSGTSKTRVFNKTTYASLAETTPSVVLARAVYGQFDDKIYGRSSNTLYSVNTTNGSYTSLGFVPTCSLSYLQYSKSIACVPLPRESGEIRLYNTETNTMEVCSSAPPGDSSVGQGSVAVEDKNGQFWLTWIQDTYYLGSPGNYHISCWSRSSKTFITKVTLPNAENNWYQIGLLYNKDLDEIWSFRAGLSKDPKLVVIAAQTRAIERTENLNYTVGPFLFYDYPFCGVIWSTTSYIFHKYYNKLSNKMSYKLYEGVVVPPLRRDLSGKYTVDTRTLIVEKEIESNLNRPIAKASEHAKWLFEQIPGLELDLPSFNNVIAQDTSSFSLNITIDQFKEVVEVLKGLCWLGRFAYFFDGKKVFLKSLIGTQTIDATIDIGEMFVEGFELTTRQESDVFTRIKITDIEGKSISWSRNTVLIGDKVWDVKVPLPSILAENITDAANYWLYQTSILWYRLNFSAPFYLAGLRPYDVVKITGLKRFFPSEDDVQFIAFNGGNFILDTTTNLNGLFAQPSGGYIRFNLNVSAFSEPFACLFSTIITSGPISITGLHLIADPIDNDTCTHWKIRWVRAFTDNTVDVWVSDNAVIQRNVTQLVELNYAVGDTPSIKVNGIAIALTKTVNHVGGVELDDSRLIIGAAKLGINVNSFFNGYLFNFRVISPSLNLFLQLDKNTPSELIAGFTTYGKPADWESAALNTADGRVLSTKINTNGSVDLLVELDIDSSTNMRDYRYWLGELNPSGIVLVSRTATTPVGSFIFKWRPLHDKFIAYELDIEKNGVPFYNNIVTTLQDVAALTTGQSNDYTWKVRGKLAESPDVWGTWTYSWYFRYEDDGNGENNSLIKDVHWLNNSYEKPYGPEYSRVGVSNGEFTLTEQVNGLQVRWGENDFAITPQPLFTTGFPRIYSVTKPILWPATKFYVRAFKDNKYTSWESSDEAIEHPGTPAAPSYYKDAVTSVLPASSWVSPTGGAEGHWTKSGYLYIIVKIPARAAGIKCSCEVKTKSGDSTIWVSGGDNYVSVPYPYNSNNIPDSVTFIYNPPDISAVKGGIARKEARTIIWAVNAKGESERIGAYHYFSSSGSSYSTSSSNVDTPPAPSGGSGGSSSNTGAFDGGASGGGGPSSGGLIETSGSGNAGWDSPISPTNNNDDTSNVGFVPEKEKEGGVPAKETETTPYEWSPPAPIQARFILVYYKVAYFIPTYEGYPGRGCGYIKTDDSVEETIIYVPNGVTPKITLPRNNVAKAANASGNANAKRWRSEHYPYEGNGPYYSYPWSDPGAPWWNGCAVTEWYKTVAFAQGYSADGSKVGSPFQVVLGRLAFTAPDLPGQYFISTQCGEEELSNVWPPFPNSL